MPLPVLDRWDETRDALHRAADVLGRIRKAGVPPQPNALHLALFVTRDGLTTGPLANGAHVDLDFRRGSVRGMAIGSGAFEIPLGEHQPQSLLDALTGQLGLNALSVDTSAAAVPFELDARLASDYADTLNAVYTGLARFRAQLLGTMTPLVVWPHGFDLSGIWFFGHNPDEHSVPHINLGFSPGSEGLPRPYLYAYAWPWPEGAEARVLPPPARWHQANWKGAVADYDDFRAASYAAQTVEELAAAFFEVLTSDRR